MVPVHPPELAVVGRRAEELGFESLWVGEHVVTPWELSEPYPGPTGKPPFLPNSRFVEPFATLSHLAAVTSRVKLGTGVLILPLHSPFHLARQIATTDVLSAGRVLLGLGAGWMIDEFEITHEDWPSRGARMDEALVVLDKLWNDERAVHDGPHYPFPAVGFEPKPVQRPHPPFLIGGGSRPALRRAATVGDGWYGTGGSPEVVAPLLDEIRRLRRELGRDRLPFDVTVSTGWGVGFDARLTAAYEALGVDRVVVTPWPSSREALTSIEAFAAAAGLEAP
jgi:probable F420-dependent oxidoreductase